MTGLNRKAWVGLLRFLAILAVMLFVPAWTLDYWQAWVLLGVFWISSAAITLYLMNHDPGLLERRMKAGAGAEKEKSQKVIQVLASAAVVAVFLAPAVDHRYARAGAPPWAALAGDALVALGFVIVFYVFRENTFTSGIIEVDAGQKVISTGPYAWVRHPMYTGALIMLAGVSPALGSWRGLLAMIPMTLVIVWRLHDEEKFLARELPGYAEYQNSVKCRLLPFMW
jgi:protein-S-isoprenylcysteine O-methyltransferase Ste14